MVDVQDAMGSEGKSSDERSERVPIFVWLGDQFTYITGAFCLTSIDMHSQKYLGLAHIR